MGGRRGGGREWWWVGVRFGSVVLGGGRAGKVSLAGGGVTFVGLLRLGARSDDLRPAMACR